MNNENRVIKALGELGVALIVLSACFWRFVVVPEVCPSIGSYPTKKNASGNDTPLNRTIYKIYPLTQAIVYWMPGFDETPRRLVNCVVRSEENWIGYYPDQSGSVQMLKGKIVTEDVAINYVSWWRWWLMRLDT